MRLCAWCDRPLTPKQKRYCSISHSMYGLAIRQTDTERKQRMRHAGRRSGEVRRATALRRVLKKLGGAPVSAREIAAYRMGWKNAVDTMRQRKRISHVL